LPSACSNCGAPVENDAVFCSRCGLNVTVEFKGTPLVDVTAEVSDTFRRLRESLGDRYSIERELGRGGMATVFLATDRKHDREVAIKVLHPDLSASIGAERFEREIKLAAKLQHPHILGLYDSGAADGLLYYVMPFVKGESLRDRLNREGMLPIEDALQITLEVASALGHAHEKGIVHRDIKPENILLSGEHSLVADFGIARAATEAGQQKLTQTGMAVGTPVYMAPEQSTGDAVGPTADIYSLGCMLYEMLAGEPPFSGPNAMAIMARHLMEMPPSVRVVRSTVPEEVEEAIYLALNKAPVDRPQTAAAFAELVGMPMGATSTMRIMRATPGGRRTRMTAAMGAMNTQTMPVPDVPTPFWKRPAALLGAFALVVGGGLGAYALSSSKAPGGAAVLGEEARRVAVLYFDDRSRDSSLAGVADGLTEGLIRTLSTSSNITVISRDGVLPYRGASVAVDSISRALRVGFVVRGEVEPDRDPTRDRVFVRVRLDDASGAMLESGAFDFPSDSILAIQDTLGNIAANLIRTRLGAELRIRAQRAATQNTNAWILVQRGTQSQRTANQLLAQDLAAANRTFDAADSLFAVAATLDTRWAEPHVMRAALALRRAQLMGGVPGLIRPWVEAGIGHADRALERDPNNADALEARGTIRFYGQIVGIDPDEAAAERSLAAAITDLERATQVNRTQAGAFARLAQAYARSKAKTTNDVYLAAQQALLADEFQATANQVIAIAFTSAYDLGYATRAEGYCVQLQQRFPRDPRSVRCQLYLMTMPNRPTPDIQLAWRLVDSAHVRTIPRDTLRSRLINQILVAGAIAQAAGSDEALKDSSRRVVRRAQRDGTVDPSGELALFGAGVMAMLGDGEEAVRLLRTYIAANPRQTDSYREDPGWWFRSIADRPDFVQLVAPRRP